MAIPATRNSQSRGLPHAFKVRKPAHAVFKTAVWLGDAAPPSNPKPRALVDAEPEPVPGALVAERNHPLPTGAIADGPCCRVGDMVSAASSVGTRVCRVQAGAAGHWTSAGARTCRGSSPSSAPLFPQRVG